jgi:hypothetical protein
MNFEEVLEKSIKEAVEKNFTLQKAEELAFARFDERTVSVNTAADILGKHPDTIRAYVKYKMLTPEPRNSERSPYRFRLSEILKFRKETV